MEFLPKDTPDEVITFTEGLEDSSKVQNFVKKLKQYGFLENEIKDICYDNFHRVIQKVLV